MRGVGSLHVTLEGCSAWSRGVACDAHGWSAESGAACDASSGSTRSRELRVTFTGRPQVARPELGPCVGGSQDACRSGAQCCPAVLARSLCNLARAPLVRGAATCHLLRGHLVHSDAIWE